MWEGEIVWDMEECCVKYAGSGSVDPSFNDYNIMGYATPINDFF